ncbi:MAG: transglutaminase-like domain-containing protein [Flavobacteriales bacterium]|nr:transglutaminase-like domain-containing protein [Flavobacteriales bacterium]
MRFSLADTEVQALIRLLDDPDDHVFKSVSQKLVSYGKTVIPHLETEWEVNAQNGIQDRIEEIIDQIEFDACKTALTIWKDNGAKDLLEGAIIASMFQYPDQPIEFIKARIELLRRDVWIELNDHLTSLEKVRVINHILYDVYHFGPFLKYHSSDQSWFIANVLEHLKGSPTTMAILYKAIADRLELPIVGINLPDHFILGYLDMNNATGNDLLFYINPFSKGAVFGKGELERYIEKMGIEMHADDLKPQTNDQIIKRLLTDLKACYRRLGKYRKLDQIDQLLSIF